jgi:hypothetical protein
MEGQGRYPEVDFDSDGYRFTCWKSLGAPRGVEFIDFSDVNDYSTLDAAIYVESPDFNSPIYKEVNSPKFVYISEPPCIAPNNWSKATHDKFDYVFTSNTDLIDGKKYFRHTVAHRFPATVPQGLEGRDRFCVLVAHGAKSFGGPSISIYHERHNTANWFSMNHPEELDLYGIGWPGSNRCYKGVMNEPKTVAFQRYKFSICYENTKDFPGYVTEKLHHSLIAGCIPVYWGAADVANTVPTECFIDRRNFSNHEELYSFLHSITDEDYMRYQKAIAAYILDPGNIYKAENNASYMIDVLLDRV